LSFRRDCSRKRQKGNGEVLTYIYFYDKMPLNMKILMKNLRAGNGKDKQRSFVFLSEWDDFEGIGAEGGYGGQGLGMEGAGLDQIDVQVENTRAQVLEVLGE